MGGDIMWAMGGLGWYDFDVYDRIMAQMVKFNSKDPRAVARTLYTAARAQHFTPHVDNFAKNVSQQKYLNGWAPHEQADLLHGWAMIRSTGQGGRWVCKFGHVWMRVYVWMHVVV